MIVFFASLVLSLSLALVFKFVLHKTITWTEFGIQVAIGIGIGLLGSLSTLNIPSFDTQVLNSYVSKKEVQKTSCSHSYDCDPYQYCYTNANKQKVCETRYKTCYEHTHDYDWDLKTGLGTITINRIDRQGANEPPRWTSAKIGDPVSKVTNYVSYIKSRPLTLFNNSDNQALLTEFQGKIPQYPDSVYDYHRIDRVIPVGLNVPDLKEWNYELSKFLNERGSSKQLNAVIVFTNEADRNYANAISAKWLGGKKNDVITVIGFSKYPTINWVEVISWTDSTEFKVNLRNELTDLTVLTRDDYMRILGKLIDGQYVRKPQADFKFLMDANDDDDLIALIITLISILVINVAVGVYLHKNEVQI